MKKRAQITAEQLREALDYNPDTGVFRWKAHHTNSVKVGEVAGGRHSKGYVHIGVMNGQYFAHRLAWLYVHGEWPAMAIDHINGDKADNRICNLRQVTPSMNQQNRHRAMKSSRSGLLGAVYCGFTGLYRVRLRKKGHPTLEVGRFRTAEEAHQAYIDAKRRFHEGCAL